MEIGPITGIRPVAMSSRARSAGDLSAVIQAELRKEDEDETYSPSKEQADGAFEEEEVEEDDLVEEMDESVRLLGSGAGESSHGAVRNISFFA
jgi:hypothetical protein